MTYKVKTQFNNKDNIMFCHYYGYEREPMYVHGVEVFTSSYAVGTLDNWVDNNILQVQLTTDEDRAYKFEDSKADNRIKELLEQGVNEESIVKENEI